MFESRKLGAAARKLGAMIAETRWIAWAVAGFCVGCYLTTRDPLELAIAITTLVLAHAGAWLSNRMSVVHEHPTAPEGENHRRRR